MKGRSERAARICRDFSDLAWGSEGVQHEGRAVMKDLERYNEGKLENLRCLKDLYLILGKHDKLVESCDWQLKQPWCYQSSWVRTIGRHF
jgi:hypothetical protein